MQLFRGDGTVEIGSEFSSNSTSYGINKYLEISEYPKRYVLSGRTGLSLIAEELKKDISNIALPDYCCGSMIAPFVSNGFNISFYNALNSEVSVIEEKVQAVLIMDYFGFLSDDTFRFLSHCKDNGKIIIVDATQTAFSYSKTYDLADYLVVSYRKWFDSLCAVVYSKNGFVTPDNSAEHFSYMGKWRDAAKLKEKYLTCSCGDKQEFLTLYANANHELDSDYARYKASGSEISLLSKMDSSFLRNVRQTNAKFLVDEVKKMSKVADIELMFNEVKEEDCPLFVPVLLNENKRDYVRKKLIDNNIYCPVHWPIDKRYPYVDTIYHRKELSLICDQRYGLKEMEFQANILLQSLNI